jgi:hypothetical protein
MVTLNESLSTRNTDTFSATLKTELERLRSDVLPIAHIIGEGNRLDDSDLGIIVNEVSDDEAHIIARVGVFFNEIVSCSTCSGGDGMCDEAYCELQVTINKSTGEARFEPL